MPSAWHARTPGSPSFASMPIAPRMPSNTACRSCRSLRRTPKSTRTAARHEPHCSRPISGLAGLMDSIAISIRPRSGSGRWRAWPSGGLRDEPANVLARDQLATSHRKIADVRKLARRRRGGSDGVREGRRAGAGAPRRRPDQSRRQVASRAGTRRSSDDFSKARPARGGCALEREAERYFSELVQRRSR